MATVGLGLGSRFGLEPVLVHVCEDAGPHPLGHPVSYEATRHLRLHDAASRLGATRAELADAPAAALEPRMGDPAEELLEVARRSDARLVVAGWHTPGLVRGTLATSVTEQLVGAGEHAVVMVPDCAGGSGASDALEGDSIVCGIGPREDGGRAVGGAAELAEGLGLRLVLVHSGRSLRARRLDPEPLLTAVRRVRELVPCINVRARLEPGAPPRAIERCAREENAALVVLGAGERPLARRSTTRRVARRLGCVPVVVVPPAPSLVAPGGAEPAGHGSLGLGRP